ncbi:cyclase [Salinigranum rubrum]|uniref:Cyclase n=1 Tax=Salinigranum rubrum TaxID=755307 RepID=A0A2I8VF77_9EURY|nr:cyclase family protein [Salinigranum rubrum]AUV80524.1 cyclase [Salinigranum rubrum]
MSLAEYVDLTHEFRDGMPGFRMRDEDGTEIEYTAEISPFLTHEETRPMYDGRASFEITEMTFQTAVGTYLDAPAHRFPGARDVADLTLDELVNDGVVVDVRGRDPYEAVDGSVLPDDADLAGAAVLFNFGWDTHWGTEAYREYPYVSEALVDRLVDAGVALVGVDTINADDDRNPARPTHTKLLDAGVPVVENLRGLDALHDRPFRFHAVPIRAVGAAAMPIRAYAELR